MDHVQKITLQLEALAGAADYEMASEAMVDSWRDDDVGIEAVEPVLRFIERHADLDLGTPGSLTHFIERFWRQGYEAQLLASLRRRPTEHTIWLLNRLLNGEQDEAVRAELVAELGRIAGSVEAGPQARAAASRFADRITRG